ncbi:hypothetical protein MTsPCn5_04570 [Croceitalea sp. MTPC5]|uniref:hypothetical protein n=1 Tax=Croceitalea sp. MTPC5 TaxID=3056565 RepID=UPI002B3F011F|nr:hypothetical protein MTsPCn5_04570 [Croceitalea sp. MTPC5]
MYRKLLLLPFLFLIINGCDSEESEQTNLPDDTVGEVDTTAPIPTITGLELDLEVATTIDISIQEASDIEEILVFVNQSEILNTKEKTFSFELNPFDYPNGENTLSIIAKDSEGNQSEENQTFEVNKLLASIASPYLIDNGRVFISANKMTGELITTVEVFRDFEIVKLYADDDFTEQPIVVTSYVMLGENNLVISEIKSIASITPGTDLVKFQDNARSWTENTFRPGQDYDYFSFSVEEIESERIARSLSGGSGIGLTDFVGVSIGNVMEQTNGFTGNLRGRGSSNSTLNNILIHTTNSSLGPDFEKITMNDYKYLFVNDPNGQSISYSQFRSLDKIGEIQLPNNVEPYFIEVSGYKDETAYHNQNYSSMYTSSLENVVNGAIEIPIVDDFNLIISNISFSINGYSRMSASVVGEKSIEIPNWNAQKSQESIFLTGDFDLFKLSFSKTSPSGDRLVSWEYFHEKQDEVKLNIESFEFPEIIESLAEISQYDLESIKTPDRENIELIGSTGNLKYEELLFDRQNGIPRPYNAAPVDVYTLTTTL